MDYLCGIIHERKDTKSCNGSNFRPATLLYVPWCAPFAKPFIMRCTASPRSTYITPKSDIFCYATTAPFVLKTSREGDAGPSRPGALLSDVHGAEDAFTEAIQNFKSPDQLRRIFVHLASDHIAPLGALWNKFRMCLCSTSSPSAMSRASA